MTSYRFDRRPYRFVRLSAAAVIASVAMITPATAETLAEAVTLTYQNNPTLLGQRAELRALNESYVQARAGLRPQLSVSAEGDYSNNLSTAFTGLPVGAVGLSVSQPIYTGGAVTAQVRASIADIMASRERLLQTEANVLQNVIQYYADVLRDQQAVVIAQDSVSVLTRQREETQARLAAGDLTRTDVAQSEARLAAARAQLTSAEAQLAFSRANYAGVVGQNPGTLAPQSPLIGVPGNVDEALEAATNTGPLVLSAFYSEQAASAKVSQAKAAYHPSVSLQAQYGYQDYVSADPALNVRTGILERNLTASVVVVQPLYAGGANASHVRQARELDNAQILGIDAARRQAIEALVGPLQAAKADAHRSPGRMVLHYAPDAPVRLDVESAQPGEAYLTFAEAAEGQGVFNLSPAGDLEEAAANLFAYLRAADRTRPTAIAVAPIPNHGLGEAINDRLRRAAGFVG
jgi:outer membrane protein